MIARKLATAWRASLLRLAAALLVAMLLGVALDALWLCLALALAIHLAWHLVNLFRLHRWLKEHRRFSPPEGLGIWSEIFEAMYRRQKESRRRKQRLLSIVREFREATIALPDGVVILDHAFRIQWFNPGASALMDFRKSQDLGRPLTHLMRDPAVRHWLERADAGPEGLVVSAPSGDRRLRLRMFRYAEGQYLLVARDITQIQRVEAMRKDFVANVSHELRTPLTVISGYVETMAGETSAEWQPIVRRLEEQTARMRAIVEDLLTLSRLDASQTLDQEVAVNVRSLVHSVASEAEMLSQGRHELVWDAEAEPIIMGSPKDLRSAFMNLVSNAIRYTPAEGRIAFRWYGRDGQGVFEVADNGPGIAAQHIPRLTERFYRVSTDRSRATGGTGLGLAIVKNILALHDATLEIESQVGLGSTFRCVFPASRTLDSLSEAS